MKSRSLLNSPTSKIMGILREVTLNGGATLSTIAANLELPAPTVHRIVSELQRLGYLQRQQNDRIWRAGLGLVELSSATMRSATAISKVKIFVERLAEEIGETITFGTQAGDNVSYVLSVEVAIAQTLSFRAGRHGPLYCTSSGRIFLSRMSNEKLNNYLKTTPLKAYTTFTETHPEAIEKILTKIRRTGYAITLQEFVRHVNGAAVPVIDGSGHFYGTLGVSVPEFRGKSSRLRSFIPKLQDTATEIAKTLAERALDYDVQ